MNAENPDTDDEIGLTEEEIKEIIGNNNLEIEDLAIPDHSPHEDEGSTMEVEDKKNIDHFIEEIDLSNLDKEIATIDLSKEDTKNEDLEDDLEIDDSHFDLELKEDPPPFTPPSPPDIPPPVKKSPPVKKPQPVKPSISKTPMKTAKKTKPTQTAVANKPSIKKSTTPPKAIHKAKQEVVRAKSKKPVPTQTGMGYDTQQMKALFLLLDEMLSHLPQEKIKKFAFTREYEYYLTLLKKLGI